MNKTQEDMIRTLVILGFGPEIRTLLLCESHLQLLRAVNTAKHMTASELSEAQGLSIQNASSRLASLHMRGYLSRVDRSAESGGSEYVYSVGRAR